MPASTHRSIIFAAAVLSVCPPKVMFPKQIRDTFRSVCFKVMLSIVDVSKEHDTLSMECTKESKSRKRRKCLLNWPLRLFQQRKPTLFQHWPFQHWLFQHWMFRLGCASPTR